MSFVSPSELAPNQGTQLPQPPAVIEKQLPRVFYAQSDTHFPADEDVHFIDVMPLPDPELLRMRRRHERLAVMNSVGFLMNGSLGCIEYVDVGSINFGVAITWLGFVSSIVGLFASCDGIDKINSSLEGTYQP